MNNFGKINAFFQGRPRLYKLYKLLRSVAKALHSLLADRLDNGLPVTWGALPGRFCNSFANGTCVSHSGHYQNAMCDTSKINVICTSIAAAISGAELLKKNDFLVHKGGIHAMRMYVHVAMKVPIVYLYLSDLIFVG